MDRARIGLKPGAVPDVPLHINKENEDVVLPPRPQEACVISAKRLMEVIFSFSNSNITLLYYIDIYGNGSEVCESIRPTYILFNFVR